MNREMFGQSFVDGVGKTNKGWSITLAFGFQFMLAIVLIIVPLIYTDTLGKFGLRSILTAPPPPPPKVVDAPAITLQRIRVGGNVQAANLVKRVMPAYPPLAKQARIQGTVHFTAIIGKDGTIQNLQLASGHPLLVPAATEAVKQWVYRPTLLNGEPVEVITQIDVNFSLAQ